MYFCHPIFNSNDEAFSLVVTLGNNYATDGANSRRFSSK